MRSRSSNITELSAYCSWERPCALRVYLNIRVFMRKIVRYADKLHRHIDGQVDRWTSR